MWVDSRRGSSYVHKFLWKSIRKLRLIRYMAQKGLWRRGEFIVTVVDSKRGSANVNLELQSLEPIGYWLWQKSTDTFFQPKGHWKAHVMWWKYSIFTKRKHYFARRIQNCLPNNGNAEKKNLSTRPTPKSARYPYSTSVFEYSNNTLKYQHRVLDTLIWFQDEYSIPLF